LGFAFAAFATDSRAGKVENEPWFAPHFIIKDGALDVPPGPGLGIDIDPKFLAGAQVVAAA